MDPYVHIESVIRQIACGLRVRRYSVDWVLVGGCCEVKCLLGFLLRWEMLASCATALRCDWLRPAVKRACLEDRKVTTQRVANADPVRPSRNTTAWDEPDRRDLG
jgi:hypothetical protein